MVTLIYDLQLLTIKSILNFLLLSSRNYYILKFKLAWRLQLYSMGIKRELELEH